MNNPKVLQILKDIDSVTKKADELFKYTAEGSKARKIKKYFDDELYLLSTKYYTQLLNQQKSEGKVFISPEQVEQIISETISDSLLT